MTTLQLAAALLRNLNHHLAPGPSASKRCQRILDSVEANELLIRVLGASQLALGHELHDAVPHLGDHLLLVLGVRAPVDAHQRDVLEQHLVHSHLFDSAGSEAHNQDTAVPRRALGRLVHQADRVVHDIDAAALGRQRLDLGGPVGVVVADDVVGAKRLGDFELAGSRGGRDDGCAKSLGNCA